MDIKNTIEGNALKMTTEAGTQLAAVEVNVAIAIAKRYAASELERYVRHIKDERLTYCEYIDECTDSFRKEV